MLAYLLASLVLTCGAERWAVKAMTDQSRPSLLNDPRPHAAKIPLEEVRRRLGSPRIPSASKRKVKARKKG
jgi:hypothetical protein